MKEIREMGEVRSDKREPTNVKVFRPSFEAITGGIALSTLMMIFFVASLYRMYQAWSLRLIDEMVKWDVILGLVFPIIATIGFISVLRCRLIMSPQGLEYHGSGRVYFTEWKNIKEIRVKSFWARYSWSSIRLHKPVPRLKGWGFPWTASVDEIQLMSGFESQWRNDESELRKTMRQYAHKLKIVKQ